MDMGVFIQYKTAEERAEAFLQMVGARDKWREQIHRKEAEMNL